MATPPQPCPTCQTRAYVPYRTVRDTALYRCTTCGLATWDWSGFDFAAFYDASYWQSSDVTKGYADYFSLAGAMAATRRRRLRWIARTLDVAGDAAGANSARLKLLDAGCGPGFFVQAAGSAGFAATGVEVSDFAVCFAREQLKQDVWLGQVRREDLRGGPYDVITLWDVIEHLPDPAESIRAIADNLRPGGLVAVSTGDLATLVARCSGSRWHLYNLPEHLWFFTAESLRTLLRRAGLEPVASRYEICWYPARYLVERLESSFGLRRGVSRWLGPLGRIAVPVTLGDIVTVLARRTAARAR